MAFEKLWLGTTSAYSTATNWLPISVRNSSYAWTASGSGTNEYYLRTAANGNPGITSQPSSVYINAASATEGTVGSLTAGQWDYGDNDALGYSTIYVRLSDGTDPDSKSADYVQFYAIPIAADNVTIPVDGNGTIAGSDQSAIAINRFVTEENWNGAIGSSTSYLRIDPDYFEWRGGEGYIDIGAAAIPVYIRDTKSAQPGYRALYLRGSGITVLDLQSGSVDLTSSSATTVRVRGGEIYLPTTAAAPDFIDIYGGTVHLYADADAVKIYGGTLYLYGALASGVTIYGGEVIYMTGAQPDVVQYGGTFDELQSGATRTITAYTYHGGQLRRNKEAVTHTTFTYGRSLNVSASQVG